MTIQFHPFSIQEWLVVNANLCYYTRKGNTTNNFLAKGTRPLVQHCDHSNIHFKYNVLELNKKQWEHVLNLLLL